MELGHCGTCNRHNWRICMLRDSNNARRTRANIRRLARLEVVLDHDRQGSRYGTIAPWSGFVAVTQGRTDRPRLSEV